MKQSQIHVLLTGVGGGGFGTQVFKAMRLASTPYYIVGVDMSLFSKGLFEVDEGYIVPPASDPRYIQTLLTLCTEKGIQVLVPGSEPELRMVAKHRQEFEDLEVLLLINSSQVIDLCMNKWHTIQFLLEKGFMVPRSFLVKNKGDIKGIDIFPVVIKPTVGGGGSNNAFLAQDREELGFFCRYLLRQGLIPLVQEYVGTPDNEYTVGILTTLDGVLVNSVAIKRHILSGLSNRIKVANRTGRDELSPLLALSSGISQGTISGYEEIRAICEHMALVLEAKGPINVQCRYWNGQLYPFEINPRFSGTTSLRAMVGCNEPDILIRHHLLGEPIVPHFEYRHGRIVRGLAESYIAFEHVPRETEHFVLSECNFSQKADIH